MSPCHQRIEFAHTHISRCQGTSKFVRRSTSTSHVVILEQMKRAGESKNKMSDGKKAGAAMMDKKTRDIVEQFCSLMEKSKSLFDGLR